MANEPKELRITRTFDAPRDIVWKAWTDPKLVQKWWGPRGVTNPVCEVDARVGGRIRIVMKAGAELGPMAGQEWPMNGTFTEVTPKSRLSFSSGALDDKQ
ncbi:MAG: SRPBCC domain-containing protein, partial [Candidatus Micrarchaeota archaeon]|nr:SRPBCC domain-containing protein [Candidatus Micrarchaeota archaeon]